MQTLTLQIDDRILERFMRLLSRFQKDEIVIVGDDRIEFLRRLESSQKDLEEGRVKSFDIKTLQSRTQ